MKTLSSILVVVDRSSSAADALAKALLLARASGAHVELFMCDAERAYAFSHEYVPTGIDEARSASLIDGRHYLEKLKQSANADDVTIGIDTKCESPLYEAIVRKVMRDHPDLVIKNVSGMMGRFDVTDWQLMRTCPASLLLTRGRTWCVPPHFSAAVDASEAESEGLARDILRAAHVFTNHAEGRLHVVYAEPIEMPDAERESGSLKLHALVREHLGASATVHLLAGTPEVGLPEFAKRHAYDAMLLGALTHRLGLPAQVGTLTSKLVEALECDFLLVKPGTYQCPIGDSHARSPATAGVNAL